jgi:phosphoenolpyruvate carboxykinase (GTP)
VGTVTSPIGLLPREGDLNLSGLTVLPEKMKELMHVDVEEWRAEIPDIEAHFKIFGSRLPESLNVQLKGLRERLG